MRVSLYCIINAIIVDLRQREDSKFFDRTVYANIVSCAQEIIPRYRVISYLSDHSFEITKIFARSLNFEAREIYDFDPTIMP